MITQQEQLLKLAAENALKLVREENKKTSHTMLDKIDKEVEKSKSHDHHTWNNTINKSNFDALQQIEKMWERTERFVGTISAGKSEGVERRILKVHKRR